MLTLFRIKIAEKAVDINFTKIKTGINLFIYRNGDKYRGEYINKHLGQTHLQKTNQE